ncbi:MAG: hypothetical protein JHC61_12465 [Burkholderiaceae bacterium]|nr:hypothetical protein [Burkholderiaceae bacterium]
MGITEPVEPLAVRDILERAASSRRVVAKVMLLSVGAINWPFGVCDPVDAVLP